MTMLPFWISMPGTNVCSPTVPSFVSMPVSLMNATMRPNRSRLMRKVAGIKELSGFYDNAAVLDLNAGNECMFTHGAFFRFNACFINECDNAAQQVPPYAKGRRDKGAFRVL